MENGKKGAAVKKSNGSQRREAERWKARALFLSGLSLGQIMQDKRVALTIGAINRMVTEENLQAQRAEYDRRLKALHALHLKAPMDLAAFIPTMLKRNAIIAQAGLDNVFTVFGLGRAGVNLAKVEMRVRVNLSRDFGFLDAGSVEQEQNVVMEKVGRQTFERNVAACPLEWLYARSRLPQWAYDAGLMLRRDFEQATIGALKAFDPAKETVDGGMPANVVSDGQAQAMERLSEARAALALTFRGPDVASAWAILESAAIRGDGVKSWMSIAPKVARKGQAKGGHIEWLTAALEPVAFVYGLSPQGEVSTHLERWKRQAENGQLRRIKGAIDA